MGVAGSYLTTEMCVVREIDTEQQKHYVRDFLSQTPQTRESTPCDQRGGEQDSRRQPGLRKAARSS